MNKPLVSVVIATYNMGQYLPLAVQSILDQTYTNLEVVIIDDGSKDDTEALIQPKLADARVRYLKQENQGQPRAKNNGINACKGEFVAFCDGDDLWTPNKLELQLPCFEQNPNVAVVSTDISRMDKHGVYMDAPVRQRYSGKITEKLILTNCISFGTAIVRKDVLDSVNGFDIDLPMGIDWDLWLRISINHEFYHLNEITYLYRIWSGQMSKNYRGRIKNTFKILDKFFANNPKLLPNTLKQMAYADTYVANGRYLALHEKTFIEPISNYFKALKLYPTYVPAWKAIIKLILRR